jgi:hypothetical protein
MERQIKKNASSLHFILANYGVNNFAALTPLYLQVVKGEDAVPMAA